MSENENENESKSLNTGVALAVGFALILVFAGVTIAAGSAFGLFSGAAGDFEYPNGTSSSGFDDPQAAVSGHEQVLQNQSYTISITNNANGQETASLTYEYDPAQSLSLRTEETANGRNEIVEDYVNQQVVVAQNLTTDNVTYDRQFLQQSTPYTASFELNSFLQAANYTVTDVVESDGQTVAVFEVDQLTEQTQQQVDSVEGEVRLSESGQFTLINLNVTTSVQGQEITENQRIEFTNVNSTTVEEPDWFSTAIEQTDEPQPPQAGGGDGSTGDGSTGDGSTGDDSTDDENTGNSTDS